MAMVRRLPPHKRLDPLVVLRSILRAQARDGVAFAQAWELGRRAALGVAATHSRIDAELLDEVLEEAHDLWRDAYEATAAVSPARPVASLMPWGERDHEPTYSAGRLVA